MARFDINENVNPGVYLEERNFSIYSITQNFELMTLVIGSSRKGPFNIPIVVVSPENFVDIYGDIDNFLERKESYFHRTVKNLLTEGPVISLNLRTWDDELDRYNWISLSESSTTNNSASRTNPISNFYDLSQGFWKRSTQQFLDLSHQIQTENHLHFVNQSQNKLSILIIKSSIIGFDITVEDWYVNNDRPDYLHPKDLISDYIVDVYIVSGEWSNYAQLSEDILYKKYFNITGLRKDLINDFLNEPLVNLIKKYTVSLIPYFRDNSGKDMWIQSIINKDINENSILVAQDVEKIETYYKNYSLDLLGHNLIADKKSSFNYLSYKKNITDYQIFEEKQLDQPGNSFGNNTFNLAGREMLYGEGFCSGFKIKNLIISTSSSYTVKPFIINQNAYYIINGKKILVPNIEHFINLPNNLHPGNQICYVLIGTDEGITFKISNEQPNTSVNLLLPIIDPTKEIVLAYYKITQDISLNISAIAYGVCVDIDGYINPFRFGNESEPKISFPTPAYNHYQIIYFEKTISIDLSSYQQQRIFHLWYWLNKNMLEKVSLAIDTQGNKQVIDWIENGQDINGKYIKFAVKDINANIASVDGTNSNFALYLKDLEFVVQNENRWYEKIEPYIQNGGGIIGSDSEIHKSYYNGTISSGDLFFRIYADELDVEFYTDNIYNYLILKTGPIKNYENQKFIFEGSLFNDGIYTTFGSTIINNYYALYLKEDVENEVLTKLNIFYNIPYQMNIFEINKGLEIDIIPYNTTDYEDIWKKLFKKESSAQKWKKTIDINIVLESNQILVDINQYGQYLKKGYYILAEEKNITDDVNENTRKWTRIIDVIRWSENLELLLITTDSKIKLNYYGNVIQTEMFISIPDWIDVVNFITLNPFKPRKESFSDGTDKRLKELLNVLNNKMITGLASEKFEWRYLVDSFGGGIYQESKKELALIAASKMNAHAFINVPSMKSLRKHTGVSYVDVGGFSTSLMLSGGIRSNSSNESYSLTTEGKSNCSYVFPFVAVSDNNDNKYTLVPPASYLARMYINIKFNTKNSLIKPWTIIAGSNYRLDSEVAGLEDILSDQSLKDLYRMRILALGSYQNNIFFATSENTAEVEKSALGFVHNREILIELETELKLKLNEYHWDYYTEENVLIIKNESDEICKKYQKEGALYDFLNETIVTDEMIDAQLLVVNTYIELVRGMEKILLRVNIKGTKQ